MDPSDLHDKFVNLVSNQYVIRCPSVDTSNQTTGMPHFLKLEEDAMFTVPPLEISPLAKKLRESATELGEYSDSAILWRVNFDKLDAEMR